MLPEAHPLYGDLPKCDLHACLEHVAATYGNETTNLLQILIEVQACMGFIPADAASFIAARLAIPYARVESVASFYSFLHLQPASEYRVLFPDNITDRISACSISPSISKMSWSPWK